MNSIKVGSLLLGSLLILGGATMDGCSKPPADGGAEAPAADASPKIPEGDLIREAKGVDLSKLSEAQLDSFFQLLNSEPSACGKAHSLAKSLRDDAECRDSMVIAQLISDSLAGGISVTDLKLGLPEVVDALRVREIDITGRPVFGKERAPVTIVVFADFQCPHCAAEAPVIRKAVREYRGQAKIVYRHFPLNGHTHAKRASMATEAAFAEGDEKFWAMHDLVFDNQAELFADPDQVDAKLRAYAEKIGLDLAKYDAFMAANGGEKAIEKDRTDGEKLKITGTPAVFVNGRYYTPVLFGGSINGWIDDALRR
jgi:protein-disulfide isomerase